MPPAPLSMSYEFSARTDQGRVRINNEDAIVVDDDAQIAILADGMGGYNAGEVASAMATRLIRTELAPWLAQAGAAARPDAIRRALEDCVSKANQAIFDAALINPRYAGMGTTLLVAVFHGSRLTLGHVGDSRCYRLRDGALWQITRDHSWLQAQTDAGQLRAGQGMPAAQRKLLTRALGVEPRVRTEINELRVAPDDLFVLCSDGLTDMVPDAELAQTLHAPLPLAEKTTRLVEQANANGGHDNVSVLLVQAATGQRRTPLSRWIRNS